MLGLPKNTEVNKQLPKKAIYSKFHMNTAEKEKIDADISRITIVNEITPQKVNILAGETVSSFFVLFVVLKRKDFSDKSIITISKLIPQNIIFVLDYDGESKVAIYHKRLMKTNWKPTEKQQIELQGLNLDTVWNNIVKDVELDARNDDLKTWNDNLSLNENIELHDKIDKLNKQIEKLEKQARAEKQPKKKLKLAQEIKILKQGVRNL